MAGLLHDKPFPPIPFLLACHFDHFSLTSGTEYESHPPEVRLGKVVSGLLRAVDVLFAKMMGDTLFPDTQEIRQLVQPSDNCWNSLAYCIAR